MASSRNVVIPTSGGRLSHLDDGTVSKMFKHTARHVMKDPAVASVLATSAPQPVKLSTTGASSPRSVLRQPDLVHRGAPLRYSAMAVQWSVFSFRVRSFTQTVSSREGLSDHFHLHCT